MELYLVAHGHQILQIDLAITLVQNNHRVVVRNANGCPRKVTVDRLGLTDIGKPINLAREIGNALIKTVARLRQRRRILVTAHHPNHHPRRQEILHRQGY